MTDLATLYEPEDEEVRAQVGTWLRKETRLPRHVPIGRFPGPLPTPLSVDTVHVLRHQVQHYWVTPKVDGIRALLYICPRGVYLVDRKMVLYRIGLVKPRGSLVPSTILDGEVVLLQEQLFFLAFDCIVHGGENFIFRALSPRLDALRTCVPYLETGPGLLVQTKPFVPLSQLETLSSDPFPTDGVIIMRDSASCGYHFRPSHSLLKWKPSPTIDVRVDSLRSDDLGRITAYAADSEPVLVHMTDSVSLLSGCIVECSYLQGAWWTERLRPDKLRPNTLRTIQQTFALCKDPVSPPTRLLAPASPVADVLVDMMGSLWVLDPTLELELRLWTQGGLTRSAFSSLLSAMEQRVASSSDWTREQTHTLDKYYDTGARYSYDWATLSLLATVYKRTIKTRNIRLSGRGRYSLRATLKEEQPFQGACAGALRNTRTKKRIRFVYLGMFAFDFTRVGEVYEIEVEVLRTTEALALPTLMRDLLRYTVRFLLDYSTVMEIT